MRRSTAPAHPYLDNAPPSARPAAAARLAALAAALEVPESDLWGASSPFVSGAPGDARDRVWLALVVLGSRLVDRRTTTSAARDAVRRGPVAVAEHALAHARWDDAEVRVVGAAEGTIVNLGDLGADPQPDDLQRTARHVVDRWSRRRPVHLVRWGTAEHEGRLLACGPDGVVQRGAPVVLVPWRGAYVVPRLARDVQRARLSQALAVHSSSWTAGVVEDSAPLTSPERVPFGRPSQYANALGALRHFRRVVAPSQAAADVLAGWRTMLAAIDEAGPDVRVVPPSSELPVPDDAALDEARLRFTLGDFPLVLSVATDPARSHRRSVLHAAELLWREGLQFTLTLVGPDGDDADVRRTITRLQREGRPVEAPRHLSEELLAAAYRVARFAVLPAVDDGAALPVVDALASGTPVVAARFGAGAERAAAGGGLLVDPRDHHALTSTIRTLLTEPQVHDSLRLQIGAVPQPDAEETAEALWAALTSGTGVAVR